VGQEAVADVSGHTSSRMTGRIEVIACVSGRRFWTIEQKLAMLRDASGPGGSVRGAIERHEVSSGLLYTWRKKAMSGLLFDPPVEVLPAPEHPGFVEVRVMEPLALAPPLLTASASVADLRDARACRRRQVRSSPAALSAGRDDGRARRRYRPLDARRLSHQQDVLPALRELAVRHVSYGARVEHYPIVGDALLWMIDRISSPEVDLPTRAAWRAAYDLVAEAMIEAAYESVKHDRRAI
jgi:transposase-like protein